MNDMNPAPMGDAAANDEQKKDEGQMGGDQSATDAPAA